MKMTGAGILVEELARQGVDTIFGYPGGYVLGIYDELYKNAHRIRHILPASEQGGAFAADGYARVSGKAGTVIATGGPGATNLVTGIAAAHLDSVPVVYITGNVAVPMLGQDSFQDIDIIGVTMPIVKHSYVVKDIADLQSIVCRAFQIANSGRKGPVLIDIPKNIQSETFEYYPGMTVPETGVQASDLSGLGDAVKLILKSKRPLIYCGGGVTASLTGTEIIKLSELLGAPVSLSLMGIGCVPHTYELNLGLGGMHGRYPSIAAMSEADLIIAAGVRFSDRATGGVSEYRQNTSILHIDIDAAEIGKNIRPDVSLCGDLREILPALLEKLSEAAPVPDKYWAGRVMELKKQEKVSMGNRFSPRLIVSCVNEHYADNTVVTTDVGQHQMWVAQHYKFNNPRTLVSSGGLGAMGYGLGAAIGASVASGGKRTVLFTGDGSLGMNMGELATAMTLKLPVTIIVMDNNALGMVRQQQALFFEKRYSNTTLMRSTDFAALAKAFGAEGFKAETITQLKDALPMAPNDRPCLIDCKISIDEMVLPMIPPGGGIEDIITEGL